MGNDLDCCSSHAASMMPEYNFLDPNEEDIPEIKCGLPESLADNTMVCCPANTCLIGKKS